jgi:pimeloyl-ACP methyl ester carboxylesterase
MPYATNPDDGVRICYEVEGAGPPLVLHIGFLGRLQSWRRVGMVDALQHEYRLILMDPRGQGKSDKPHYVQAYAVERFVTDIVAVLDDLGVDRANFLGYSMGAAVGFAAGVFAPDRLRSLILGGSHPYFNELADWVIFASLHEDAAILAQGMEAFVSSYEEKYGPLPPDVREQWLDNDGKALAANTLAVEAFPDISGQLPQIGVPTLIYCGTEDEPFAQARRASEVIPGARFVPLNGLNHTQAFRQSEDIVPHILEFLSEIGAQD